MENLINKLDVYFGQKAPKLPKGFKEFLVQVTPYLAVLGVIGLAFSTLAIFGVSGFAFAFGGSFMIGVNLILSVALIVIYIIAIPGLFKRTSKGWTMMFYAMIVGSIQSLITASIVGFILTLLFGLYFLYQIKPYYFGGATIDASTGGEQGSMDETVREENPAQAMPNMNEGMNENPSMGGDVGEEN